MALIGSTVKFTCNNILLVQHHLIDDGMDGKVAVVDLMVVCLPWQHGWKRMNGWQKMKSCKIVGTTKSGHEIKYKIRIVQK